MNILVRLVFFLALVSAPYSSSPASEVSPSLLSQLRYGMTRDNVIGVLGKDGFPLFRLRLDTKDYFAETYVNNDTNEKFVFVYEGNTLSGVITAEAAKSYWQLQFKHNYGHRYVVPDALQLANIATTAITSRLDIDRVYRKSLDNKEKPKIPRELAETAAANALMPLGLMMYIATAPVSIPLTGAALIDAKTSESDFIKTVLKIPLGSSIEDVSSALGQPIKRHLVKNQEVLVYVPRWNSRAINRNAVTLGFVENQLEWIGYYYLCCVRDEIMFGRVLTRKETEQPKRLLLYDGPIYDFEILLENSEKIDVKDKLGKFRAFGPGDCVQVHFIRQAISEDEKILSRTDSERCAGINSLN